MTSSPFPFCCSSVSQITNNRDSNRSVTYTYDELSRIKTAETNSSTLWGESIGYDDWGNLLSKTQTKGTAENLSQTVDAHNKITGVTGVSYDAAGNMTGDGLNTFSYNAENQMTDGAGKTFTYDGDGRRVSKSGWRLYWPDPGFSPLVETDFSGNAVKEYVYFNGERVAFVSSAAGNPYYYLHDHLGSASVITGGGGTSVEAEFDYYPFGGQRQITNSLSNRYQFTTYEHDWESDNDYAVFRQYSGRLGRFMSADPVAGNVGSPQSLNRYSYVSNNPTNATDLLGLSPSDRDPHEPHFQDVVTSVSDNNCIVNGFATSCATAARWLNEGIAVSCPQCQPGDIVGADNRIYRWYPDIYTTNYVGSVGHLDGMRLVQARGWYASGSAATSGGGGNGYCSQPGTLQYNVFCSANAVRTWRASSKVADAGLIATAGIVAGVPLAGEVVTSTAGEALFARQTATTAAGWLNQPNAFLRLGWSYWGSATWGIMATKGQDVFRFGIGSLHVYPFYSLWSWQ